MSRKLVSHIVSHLVYHKSRETGTFILWLGPFDSSRSSNAVVMSAVYHDFLKKIVAPPPTSLLNIRLLFTFPIFAMLARVAVRLSESVASSGAALALPGHGMVVSVLNLMHIWDMGKHFPVAPACVSAFVLPSRHIVITTSAR